EAVDADVADEDGLSFVDEDLDADVRGIDVLDPGDAGASIVVAAGSVVALDTRQVALKHHAVERAVRVDDAAEQPDELAAGRRRDSFLDIVLIELVRATDRHVVDGRTSLRDR